MSSIGITLSLLLTNRIAGMTGKVYHEYEWELLVGIGELYYKFNYLKYQFGSWAFLHKTRQSPIWRLPHYYDRLYCRIKLLLYTHTTPHFLPIPQGYDMLIFRCRILSYYGDSRVCWKRFSGSLTVWNLLCILGAKNGFYIRCVCCKMCSRVISYTRE